MDADERARRLFRHGMVLVLAGLLMGMVVQLVANPRMGLSAHTGTLMTGILVIALGALWPRLVLSPRLEAAAYGSVVTSSYLSSGALFLAGVFGTSRSTPLHGAGHTGTPAQETLVEVGLVGGAVLTIVGFAIVLYGLRRPR